jgi:O-antigen ligase
LFVFLVTFVLLTQVAATGGSATALAIASFVGAVAPFVLKLVPLDGSKMLLVTMLASVGIGIVAGAVTGELKLPPDANDVGTLYADATIAFGLSQVVFAYFKDHPLGPLAVK